MKKLILSIFIVLFSSIGYAEYSYKAKVISIYDADTFTLEFDIWPGMKITEPSRLMGLDTPELRTDNECEKEHGYKAKEFTQSLILGKTFDIIVYERDKFGRPLVNLIFENGKTLTQTLIGEEFAYDYHGEKKKVWFPNCPDVVPMLGG